MIVGLTGPSGSGKGSVADYLIEKGFVYLSLSNFLREEAKKIGVPDTRLALQDLGNRLRRRNGPGFLAELAVKKILSDKNYKHKNYVVDSIRNPEEVQCLRRLCDFFLISVDAPVEVRYKRIIARGREENAPTLTRFIEIEKRENEEGPERIQVLKCMELADFFINNNRTLADLKLKTKKTLKNITERLTQSL
ncbi:MAG: AAA family ATPase [Candidatus Woesearchaeota archaeon]